MTADGRTRERRAAVIFGLLIAFAVDIGWLFTLFPYMAPNPWRWPIAAVSCLAQTILTVAGVVLAADLHRKLRVSVWLALPYGVIAGALAGALSIGAAIGIRGVLGMQAGMIVMMREAAWLNDAPLWRQFWEGAAAGLAFGAVGGFIPGAIGSLALSIWRLVRTRRSISLTSASS